MHVKGLGTAAALWARGGHAAQLPRIQGRGRLLSRPRCLQVRPFPRAPLTRVYVRVLANAPSAQPSLPLRLPRDCAEKSKLKEFILLEECPPPPPAAKASPKPKPAAAEPPTAAPPSPP